MEEIKPNVFEEFHFEPRDFKINIVHRRRLCIIRKPTEGTKSVIHMFYLLKNKRIKLPIETSVQNFKLLLTNGYEFEN